MHWSFCLEYNLTIANSFKCKFEVRLHWHWIFQVMFKLTKLQQFLSTISLQSADTVHMYVHKKLSCFLIGWESIVWQNKTLFCNTDWLDMHQLQWNSFESFRKAYKCENQGNGRVSQTCICDVETQFIAIFLFQLKMK